MTNHIDLLSPRDGETSRALVAEHGSPLLVLDCEVLRRAYRELAGALPGVGLYYAVKSLPAPAVVSTLAALGAGFDLASAGEVAMVQGLGISPRRTIHTHPIKTDAEIRAALRYGCTTFVVDNAYELQKLVRYRRRVGLLLRVSFRSPSALVDLSRKFGCRPDGVEDLLTLAHNLGLHVKGFSFHVGSQSTDPTSHVQAIERCRQLFDAFRERGRAPMSILDIGGGFPVPYGRPGDAPVPGLAAFCEPIRAALARLPGDLEVIAEPGRCLAAPAVHLICTIVGKAERGDRLWYYLDEGVYGAFSGQIYDGVRYPLAVFGGSAVHERCVLAGPTCDSVDIVAEDVALPDLGLGEVVVASQMGAYTAASATEFNSLPRTRMVALNESEVRTPAPVEA